MLHVGIHLAQMGERKTGKMELIKPKRLQKGDTIGFVAPCYVIEQKETDRAKKELENLGYHVKYAPNLFSSEWGFAGTAQQRADDFNGMIKDNDVKMLLFTGGEVSTDLLPLLDYSLIRSNAKIICSYSDSTTLLSAIYSKSKIVTFYGQSIRTFNVKEPYNLNSFIQRIAKGELTYTPAMPWYTIYGGIAQGELIGGYLGNYALIQNTKYYQLEDNKKYLLFLEDHENFVEPAAVSRYLSALEQDGLFEHTSGLIFGHYSEHEQPLIKEILGRIGNKYNIPVVWTQDFGHGRYNSIFPIGVEAELNADSGEFRFLESGVID